LTEAIDQYDFESALDVLTNLENLIDRV